MRPPTTPDSAERERLARQGVEELTEMLRSEASWSDLRDQLVERGVDPSSALLAAFMESEDCEQFGALVTPERRVLAFKRAPVPESLVGAMYLVRLVYITDARVAEDADAMATAVKAHAMLDSYLLQAEGPPVANDPLPSATRPSWLRRLLNRRP